MTPVVLVAHGSRDTRAAASTRAVVRAVAAARPGLDVRAAYLEHTSPAPAAVLGTLSAAGHRAATVVPLLLTAAYHGRVDLPAVLDRARLDGLAAAVSVTDVLGPVGGRVHPELLGGLRRRLAGAGVRVDAARRAGPRPGTGGPGPAGSGPAGPGGVADAVVLAAAGTRDPVARETVEQAAAALGAALGLPCQVAYASAAGPTGGEAVRSLRRAGARAVAVAAYFLAPGQLYRTVVASAREAGVVAVAEPLGDAPEIARLILDRVAGRAGHSDAPERSPGASDCLAVSGSERGPAGLRGA